MENPRNFKRQRVPLVSDSTQNEVAFKRQRVIENGTISTDNTSKSSAAPRKTFFLAVLEERRSPNLKQLVKPTSIRPGSPTPVQPDPGSLAQNYSGRRDTETKDANRIDLEKFQETSKIIERDSESKHARAIPSLGRLPLVQKKHSEHEDAPRERALQLPKPPPDSIFLHNPLGVTHMFIWDECKTWEGFESRIKKALQALSLDTIYNLDVGKETTLSLLQKGHYNLCLEPGGWIINSIFWETKAFPNCTVTMQLKSPSQIGFEEGFEEVEMTSESNTSRRTDNGTQKLPKSQISYTISEDCTKDSQEKQIKQYFAILNAKPSEKEKASLRSLLSDGSRQIPRRGFTLP